MTKFGVDWWFYSVLTATLVIGARSATVAGLTAMTTTNSEESVGVDRPNDTSHPDNNTQTDKNTEMGTIPYSRSPAEDPLGAVEGKPANDSKDDTQEGMSREEESLNPYLVVQPHHMMGMWGSERHNAMATELSLEELLSLGTVDGLAMTPLRWQCAQSSCGNSHGVHFKVYCYCDALCHVFNDCCLGVSNHCNFSTYDRSTPLQMATQLGNTSTPDDEIDISAAPTAAVALTEGSGTDNATSTLEPNSTSISHGALGDAKQNTTKSSNLDVDNEDDFNVSSGRNNVEVGRDANQVSPRSINAKPASISLPPKKPDSPSLADTAHSITNKVSCYTPGLINDIRQDTKGPALGTGRYWMVDQCPDEWTDDVVRDLCSAAYTNINTHRDVAVTQPVTDQRTSVAYKNRFCALCHGVEFGLKWKLSVYCKNAPALDLLECSSFHCVIEKIRQNTFNCNGYFKPDLSSRALFCFPDLTDGDYPECNHDIVEGRVIWSGSKRDTPLQNACKAYTNPLLLAPNNVLYKNYHCLVCYTGLEHFGCRENSATDATNPFELDAFSFSAFLNTGDIEEKQEELASGLMCPPGYLVNGQTCQPVLYNLTNANYLLVLEFEPLGWSPSQPFQCQILRREIKLKPVGVFTKSPLQVCEIMTDPVTCNLTVTLKIPVTFVKVLTDYGQGLKKLACIRSFYENELKSKDITLPEGRLRVPASSQDTEHCPRLADKDDGKADGDRKPEKRPAQKKGRGLVIASETMLIMATLLLCRTVI